MPKPNKSFNPPLQGKLRSFHAVRPVFAHPLAQTGDDGLALLTVKYNKAQDEIARLEEDATERYAELESLTQELEAGI